MLLVIDNFDSFTYNLVQYFSITEKEVKVVRNGAQTVKECLDFKPKGIVIGPGPGNPGGAGISTALILACTGKIPLLGICLGHQCLAAAYGGTIRKAKKPMHGMVSAVCHSENYLFQKIVNPVQAARYHSLAVDKESLPDCLEVIAYAEDDGEIMGLRHRTEPFYGLQFHPESIATPCGKELLNNFIKETGLC